MPSPSPMAWRGAVARCARKLARLLEAVSDSARFSPVQRSPLDRLTGNYSLDQSPGYLFLESMSRMFSPYDLNPLGINPLRGLLADLIDFDRVNALTDLSVHVTATNVRTGRPRVFGPGELSADAVLASACLPQMFPAVEIDGEAYWDGGFSGNPALYPVADQHRVARYPGGADQPDPARHPAPHRARHHESRQRDSRRFPQSSREGFLTGWHG